MKFEQLMEGFSPVLYHFTTFDRAERILRTNELRSMDGISFSRSIVGSYPKDYAMIGVIFVVDGMRLRQRHSGNPFGGEDLDDDFNTIKIGKTDQMEDRIRGNIQNFSDYVTGAVIYLDEKNIRTRKSDELEGVYGEQLERFVNFFGLLERARIPSTVATSFQELPTAHMRLTRGSGNVSADIENIKRILSKTYHITAIVDDPRGFGSKMMKLEVKSLKNEDAIRKKAIQMINDRWKSNPQTMRFPLEILELEIEKM